MKKSTFPRLASIYVCDLNGIHPDVSDIARLADMNQLVSPLCLNGSSPKEVIRYLLLNPIVVSKKTEKYFVVAGFRGYQVALASLPSRQKIPVLDIGRSSPSERLNWAASSVLLSPLVGSLGKGAAGIIGATWMKLQDMHPPWQTELFGDCTGLRALARKLDINYNSLFR